MNDIKIFNSPKFGNIRVAGDSDNPMFCLSDVCGILGLTTKGVNQRLEKGVISNYPLETAGGTQQALFVNEDGLYDVILDSRKPEARQFRKWITSEILPSIRRTGGYMTYKENETPEELMARALKLANDTLKKKDEQIQIQRQKLLDQSAKVLFAEAVTASSKSCLIRELASIICQNGIDMGEKRLFAWMRDNGYLCKMGESRNLPTQKSMEMGLFVIKKTTITDPKGTVLIYNTAKVTSKGQIYFTNKFLRE